MSARIWSKTKYLSTYEVICLEAYRAADQASLAIEDCPQFGQRTDLLKRTGSFATSIGQGRLASQRPHQEPGHTNQETHDLKKAEGEGPGITAQLGR